MVPAHLSVLLIAGREKNATNACVVGDAFPADDPWSGSDTNTNCTLIYDLYSEVFFYWCEESFVFRCPTDREGVAYVGLPFPDTSGPVPDVGNTYLQ